MHGVLLSSPVLFSGKSRNPLRRKASMGGYPHLISISHRRKKLDQMTGVFFEIEIYALLLILKGPIHSRFRDKSTLQSKNDVSC